MPVRENLGLRFLQNYTIYNDFINSGLFLSSQFPPIPSTELTMINQSTNFNTVKKNTNDYFEKEITKLSPFSEKEENTI